MSDISQARSRPRGRTMRSLQMANQRLDTDAEIEWRKRHDAAIAQSAKEAEAKIAAGMDSWDARKWQQERIYELMGGRW